MKSGTMEAADLEAVEKGVEEEEAGVVAAEEVLAPRIIVVMVLVRLQVVGEVGMAVRAEVAVAVAVEVVVGFKSFPSWLLGK